MSTSTLTRFAITVLSVAIFSVFSFLVPFSSVFAQTADQTAQRAEWEKELQDTEAEIAQWQSVLDSTKANTASLQNEVKQLTAKINQAKAFIKQKNIQIAQLDASIQQKNQTINSLDSQIQATDDSIADLIRKTNEIDQYSLADVILSKKTLSDFFADSDTYSSINQNLENLLSNVRQDKTQTETEKQQLASQKNQQVDLAHSMQMQEDQVVANQKQKQQLISVNQNQEKTYEQIIADRQAKAAQIRAELFNLRDTSAISFGDAYKYALVVQQKTNVDPAFLLAILTQESNLGQNVGTCYLSNTSTGEGVSVSTGAVRSRVMSPTRDVPIFLDITKTLGIDPLQTRVSCWIATYDSHHNPIGWGGAMGPAQFIPSTWKLYSDRIESLLGESAADPWSPQDAFMAAGLYLADLGGVNGSYSAERNAACHYYSGSSCYVSYAAGYGNSVMSRAKSIQEDMIDPINAANQ